MEAVRLGLRSVVKMLCLLSRRRKKAFGGIMFSVRGAWVAETPKPFDSTRYVATFNHVHDPR